MVNVEIVNRIDERIKEFQDKTGATKTWICNRMGYNSRQAFEKAIKNVSHSLVTYAKFACFLKVDINDMYSITSEYIPTPPQVEDNYNVEE